MSNLNGLYYPFGIVQGESFEFSFEFSIYGVEQYFDEYDFVGQVKDRDNEMISVTNMIFTESEISSDVIDVSIPSTDTTLIQTENNIYEIRCTHKTTNITSTLFYGTMTVKPSLISSTNDMAKIIPPVIPPING